MNIQPRRDVFVDCTHRNLSHLSFMSLKRAFLLVPVALVFLAAPGCLNIRTHSTIDPVHITLDVNLKVKLDKELADAFGDIDAASKTVN